MKELRDHRYLVLVILMLIFGFNLSDRQAIGLVVQDIKLDLHVSDTQMGLLEGFAFAFVYSLVGIPIARYSDRGNRVWIIVATTALWSVAVALCGLVTAFSQLLLIRVVVGLGEGGCMPPANSLIADYFPRAERPRAVAIYMQGVTVSLLIGYLAAGWLNQLYGWRAMFIWIGLPGVLLALAAWCLLKEPRRENNASFIAHHPADNASLMESLRTLWMNTTFRQLLYAFSAFYFVSYATTQWLPAYFERSFAMKSGELGTWLSVIFGVSCTLGTYLFGEWTTRRAACDEARQLKGAALLIWVSTVFTAVIFLPALTPNYYWAFLWLALNAVTQMISGPVFAVIQTLVPEHMRATAIALIYLFANLIGLGLGPWAAGALSDYLRPWAGEESLRYALLVLTPSVTAWAGYHFWKASKSVKSDLPLIKREWESTDPHESTIAITEDRAHRAITP